MLHLLYFFHMTLSSHSTLDHCHSFSLTVIYFFYRPLMFPSHILCQFFTLFHPSGVIHIFLITYRCSSSFCPSFTVRSGQAGHYASNMACSIALLFYSGFMQSPFTENTSLLAQVKAAMQSFDNVRLYTLLLSSSSPFIWSRGVLIVYLVLIFCPTAQLFTVCISLLVCAVSLWWVCDCFK